MTETYIYTTHMYSFLQIAIQKTKTIDNNINSRFDRKKLLFTNRMFKYNWKTIKNINHKSGQLLVKFTRLHQ